jgi:FMN reductase
VRALGIDGSPRGRGRTETAVRALLAAVPADIETHVISAADGPEAALQELEAADAFVFASPMYRASYTAAMKALLDRLPRGMWGETSAPITGKAVALVGTGATWHHFLGLDALRSILSGFFAAHVLPPGLYVPNDGFDAEGKLLAPFAELAAQQGAALGELAQLLAASTTLRELRPQA